MNSLQTGPYASLKIPEFRFFILGRFFCILGLQIQMVIVGWQIYSITKDPWSLGLIGLCEFLPFLVTALFSGHIADIVQRKKIIIACIAGLLVASILLWILSWGITPDAARTKIQFIYGIIFFTGIARGFIGPALFAFMPQIVNDVRLYGNAISWNSSMWQIGSVIGPAAGGFIYTMGGVKASYGAVTILLFVSFFLFFFIKGKPLPPSQEQTSMVKRLSAGFKFVFNNQIILSTISLDLFAVLFGGATALLPVFAADILKVGPAGLGILRAAPGAGAIITMVLLAHFPVGKNAGKKMLTCVAAFGSCIIVFGISEIFWISLVALFLSGAFDSVSVIVRSQLIHTHTPEHMKGRVSAVNTIFIGSSNELGAFESGAAAKLLGVVPSVVAGGAMTIGVVIVTALKAKKLRTLDL